MSWLGTQSSEPDCMSLKVGFATYQLLTLMKLLMFRVF